MASEELAKKSTEHFGVTHCESCLESYEVAGHATKSESEWCAVCEAKMSYHYALYAELAQVVSDWVKRRYLKRLEAIDAIENFECEYEAIIERLYGGGDKLLPNASGENLN